MISFADRKPLLPFFICPLLIHHACSVFPSSELVINCRLFQEKKSGDVFSHKKVTLSLIRTNAHTAGVI